MYVKVYMTSMEMGPRIQFEKMARNYSFGPKYSELKMLKLNENHSKTNVQEGFPHSSFKVLNFDQKVTKKVIFQHFFDTFWSQFSKLRGLNQKMKKQRTKQNKTKKKKTKQTNKQTKKPDTETL